MSKEEEAEPEGAEKPGGELPSLEELEAQREEISQEMFGKPFAELTPDEVSEVDDEEQARQEGEGFEEEEEEE